MIAVNDIEVTFGNYTLMKGVSFLVNPQEKVGLAGRNGAGKTTLLRIMAGVQPPTAGSVEMPNELRTGYLPQQMKVSDKQTVLEETLTAFSELQQIERKTEEYRRQITQRSDYETDEYLDLCNRLAEMEERHSMLGGGGYMGEAEQALSGLGFNRSEFNKPTSQLSGGWRMRIELAKVLLARPDLLLLDEPTNHLDIESITWLEGYLKAFRGALIMVTHDKAFLDNITTRTLEISTGRVHDYKVPYSKYLELRRERKEQIEAAYRNQKKMIDDTEKFIERFRYKATKAVQVQSRIKQLEKVEKIEIEPEETTAIGIRFAPAPRSGTIVIEAEKLTKAYGSHTVLKNTSIIIERGEKVALVGKNGEGKTTFAKIVTGSIPYEGILKRGHNVKTGYFAQNQDELLDENKTIFNTIDEIATGEVRTKIRDLLGAFLFSGDDIDKKVKVLSGGERSRLALIKLLLEPYNLLLLDEPTNHLDIRSKEILKQALLKYDGTLIIVSHDRDFLDGLVGKVYEFTNKRIRQHIGGIYDFLKKKEREDEEIGKNKKVANKETSPKNDNPILSTEKESYIQRKETARIIKKLEKEVAECEMRIAVLEKTINEMEEVLARPGLKHEEEFYQDYQMKVDKLSSEMINWERAHDELETTKNMDL
jgi:ATP-binding cassette, subfamily F, member 3